MVTTVLDYLLGRDPRQEPAEPAAPRAESESAGGEGPQRLGRYEIRERIGQGSFGTVYRAYDPVLSRDVAVKTCEAPEEDVQARFEREARLAAALRHPKIVTIHDFARADGVLFLVQELLDGEDLDLVIERREEIPTRDRVAILRDVAEGLAHAHEAGVIHRDIKPANIRRLGDGTAKILDFGIARRLGSANLTRPGLTVGSAAYMSPEQLRGEEVDVRTDVFSFGALAFELMTYRRAFPGQRVSDVFDAIEKGDVEPLSELCPDAPADLEEIVRCCLSKDREARYASGRELAEALAERRPLAAGTSFA